MPQCELNQLTAREPCSTKGRCANCTWQFGKNCWTRGSQYTNQKFISQPATLIPSHLTPHLHQKNPSHLQVTSGRLLETKPIHGQTACLTPKQHQQQTCHDFKSRETLASTSYFWSQAESWNQSTTASSHLANSRMNPADLALAEYHNHDFKVFHEYSIDKHLARADKVWLFGRSECAR